MAGTDKPVSVPVPPITWTAPRCLHHWITHTPDAPAVIEGDRVWTYRDFGVLVLRFAWALEASSVSPGMLVGIQASQRTRHLAVLLAAGLIGATSVSFSVDDLASGDPLLDRCAMVCSEIPVPGGGGRLPLTEAALAPILARPIAASDLDRLADERARPRVQRLIRTSGTTGQPKVMASTEALNQAMLRVEQAHRAISRFGWTYVTPYHPTFRSAQRDAEFAWRAGATVALTTLPELPAMLRRLAPCRTAVLVGDAVRLLDLLPPDWFGPLPVLLALKGGPIPPVVRQALRDRVAQHVEHHYGTNEVHMMGLIGADGIGTVHPSATMRVVDTDGRPLPDGQDGIIEVRTPCMVDGYLDDPEATARSFVDGWYRSFDLGRMLGPRRFVLAGRVDEMINLGGVKLAAGPPTALIRALPSVADAVLVGVPGPDHLDRLFVVVEMREPARLAEVRARIASIMAPLVSGGCAVVAMTLPRTETGKVRIGALRALLAERLMG